MVTSRRRSLIVRWRRFTRARGGVWLPRRPSRGGRVCLGTAWYLAVGVAVSCTDRAPPPAFPDPPPPVLAAPIGGELRHRELGATDSDGYDRATTDVDGPSATETNSEVTPATAGSAPGGGQDGATADESTPRPPTAHEGGGQ